jgi:hypothetical protein
VRGRPRAPRKTASVSTQRRRPGAARRHRYETISNARQLSYRPERIKMPTMIRALSLLLCPSLCLCVAAQEPAAKWDNIKAFAPGTQFRVVSSAFRKPVEGTLLSVTDSDLSLMRGTHVESFPRTQIVSVSARQKVHRLRNLFVGLGIGTAAGALIGFGIGHAQASSCQKSGGGWCDLDTVGGAGLGGISGLVSGTLLGAFWPTGKWSEVYRQ